MAISRALDRNRNGALGALLVRSLPLLAGAGLLLASSDARAFSVKRTTQDELVHWDGRDVHYSLDPSIEANVPNGAAAATDAIGSWSGAVGAPELHLVPSDAASPTAPGFDRKNGVFFMKGGYAPAGQALAITVLTYDNASGAILDADVIVNGSYSFAVLASDGSDPETAGASTDAPTHGAADQGEPGQIYDLHHVIAHEFGHSLGMNDELENHGALMYRYSSPNTAVMRQPGSDDIEGLAELYSTKLSGQGGGCGGATVSPKKPAESAQRAALFAALGLLAFLVLRARSSKRARVGFVFAAAAAAVALLPSANASGGPGVAKASELAKGDARATVLSATSAFEHGLVKTTYTLATTECRTTSCPKTATGSAWGGTVGTIRQDVGGQYAPAPGDAVDVSFRVHPDALATLTRPLAGAPQPLEHGDVRVLTRAE